MARHAALYHNRTRGPGWKVPAGWEVKKAFGDDISVYDEMGCHEPIDGTVATGGDMRCSGSSRFLPLAAKLGARRAFASAFAVKAEHARPNAKGENRDVHLSAALFRLIPPSLPFCSGLGGRVTLIIVRLAGTPSGRS